MGDEVLFERSNGIARLTINRPEARNALNQAVRDGLFEGFRSFIADDESRVLILTGTGKVLSAGLDLKEAVGFSEQDQTDVVDGLNRAYAALYGFPKPDPAKFIRVKDYVIEDSTDLELIAKSAGMSYQE